MVRCLARVCALVLLAVLASGQVVEPPFANEPPEVIGRIAPLYPPSATPAAATKKRWSSDTASPTPPPPLTPAPSVEVPPGCTLNDTLLECDDTSSVFGVYSGNWTHCSVGCAPGAYNGTSSRSDTPTDYVQLNFKGARIRLFSTVGTTRGIMTYTIGGGGYFRGYITSGLINLHSCTERGNVLVFDYTLPLAVQPMSSWYMILGHAQITDLVRDACSAAPPRISVDRAEITPTIPRWRILFLVYATTDVTVEVAGKVRHLRATMSDADRSAISQNLYEFATRDIPELSSGVETPFPDIVFKPVLTSVTRYGTDPINAYWPGPTDIGYPDADSYHLYDSVYVVWDARTRDVDTGEGFWIGWGGAVIWPVGPGTTLSSTVVEGASGMWGGAVRPYLKWSYINSILSHYASTGAMEPVIFDPALYVNCTTGAAYSGEFYANSFGFAHDVMSGLVAVPSDPRRCLGVSRAVWATGGPVTRTS